MFDVSAKTISRRTKDYKFKEKIPKYTDISDHDLDALVCRYYPENYATELGKSNDLGTIEFVPP